MKSYTSKHASVLLTIYTVYLCICPPDVLAQSELGEAATRLKQAHVVRYYERCLEQTRSDPTCRQELTALHPREQAALRSILLHAGRYDELEVSKASASCYDPAHDYLELIECWELLAAKMAAGESIKTDAPEPVANLSERAVEVFLDLTPTQKKSVVLCVRGRLNINFDETVAHNLERGGSDALWALKIYAFESAHMAELAQTAGWLDLARYYEMEADNVTKLIRGEIEFESYQMFSKDSEKLLNAVLAPENSGQSAHERNFQDFSRECNELSDKIIGAAKISASK